MAAMVATAAVAALLFLPDTPAELVAQAAIRPQAVPLLWILGPWVFQVQSRPWAAMAAMALSAAAGLAVQSQAVPVGPVDPAALGTLADQFHWPPQVPTLD
jgi:hypothetical protein